MKSNSMLKWGALVLAFAAGLACNPLSLAQQGPALATQAAQVATLAVGVAPQVSQTMVAPMQPAATTSAGAMATPAQVVAGKVGQRLIGGDFALTVMKTELNQGTSDEQPDQGNVFLLAHVVVENVSPTDNVYFDPDKFQVKDSTGRLWDFTSLSFLTDELQVAKYAPGGKVAATVGFEVSQKATGFHLLFDYGGDRPMDVTLGP